MRKLVLVLMVVGCGYAEETYRTEVISAACAHYVSCYEVYASNAECEEAAAAQIQSGAACTYDAGAATDCVDGWDTLACGDSQEAIQAPAPCGEVYSDCTTQ
jgi:hypothetical protein